MATGSNNLSVAGPSSGSGDSLHGLAIGEKIYFEDGGIGGSSFNAAPAAAPPPPPVKKRKGAAQGGKQQQPPPPPRCQVEGCMVDLAGVKTYYFRHKVCVMHSKAPRVMVEGLEQRFCQQCSRFHRLLEFDQGKRSCRRRLAGHNERRRKPPPGPFASHYGPGASSFHEGPNRFRSFLMDFSHPRLSSNTRDVRPTIRPVDWVAGNQRLGFLHPPSSAATVHGTHPYMQGPSEGSLYSLSELPRGERHAGVSDSSCALSLLSTQPWDNNTTSNQVSTISASSSFDGTLVAQPAISNNCMTNAWGFVGLGGRTSSQDGQHDLGLSRAAAVSNGHFSGELELALQGNWQYHGSSRPAYDQSGHVLHWSL